MEKKSLIPVWVIVLCFVFGVWPVAVGLIILNMISSSGAADQIKHQFDISTKKAADDTTASASHSSGGSQTGEAKKETVSFKRKRRKYKARGKGLLLAAFIILAIVSSYLLIGSIATIGRPSFFSSLISAGVTGAGAGLMFGLYERKRRIERELNRYLTIVGDREAMNLSRLSLVADKRHKSVVEDMNRLIEEGYFGPDAYLDASVNNFLSSPNAVPDAPGEFYFGYEAAQKKQEAPSSQRSEPEEHEFDEYLKKLRHADEMIDDPDVSDQIFQLEKISTSIFAFVEDHPDRKNEIRRFVNYYLPTTLKLLETYSRIEKAGTAGKNMQKAKSDIEEIMNKLLDGFRAQLDQLYGSEMLDVSTDIDVLNQMLKKDGFSDSEIILGDGAAVASPGRDTEIPQ